MRKHQFHSVYLNRKAIATKPFKARGAKVIRCEYCRVRESDCLCDDQPNIDTAIHAVLILSDNEILKPSNTGRLIADVVPNTFVYRWNRTEPEVGLLELLSSEDYEPILVFPEEYIDNKTRVIDTQYFTVKSVRKPLLIFVDATWREARRIIRKSPYLDHCKVMSFKPETISQYQMRSSINENHLATAEVAALALFQGGEPQASEALERWFKVFKESYMKSKTRIKSDDSRPELHSWREWIKENGSKE
ncbi:DTW domain-containing protein [Vibrio sp.]|nr:DTW domain-containing protein [Vibrio sp.]